jgi:hypothetical protein
MAWFTGALAWWTLAACRLGLFWRLLRSTVVAPEEVQRRVGRLARQLGLRSCPQVRIVAVAVSPLLWALGPRPQLLLPAGLWAGLRDGQRDALLAHELAHLRRRDHWVRRLELLVYGLYWWFPVAWWAGRQLREAEEQCCDAWVLWAFPRTGPDYASALVETIVFLTRDRAALPLAASGAGRAATLKRRLTMILRESPPRSLSAPGMLTVLCLSVLLLPALPSLTGQAAEDRPEAPAVTLPDEKRPEPPRASKKPDLPWGVGLADFDSDGRLDLYLTKPAPRETKQPTTSPSRLAEIQQLRDNIELLEAKLAVKRAHLVAAQQELEPAKKNLDRLLVLARDKAVSQRTVDEAQARVLALDSQVRVRQAELLEPEVLLRQARRRLAALQNPPQAAPPAASGSKAAVDSRKIQDLEKKLKALQEEIDALRKQIERQQSGSKGKDASAAPPGQVLNLLNPPNVDLRGKVLKVDSSHRSLVQIDLGSDAGLKLKNTLEVFRLAPQPKYLGRLLVLEVGPDYAIGRLVSTQAGNDLNVRPGDLVASLIQKAP